MFLKGFYNEIRPHIRLTPANVDGFDVCVLYLQEHQPNLQQAAYELATAFWETANTMQPVREAFWKSEAWRKRNLRYWPWYGRGLIQTTWQPNYKKMSPVVRADLLAKPDLLLEWEFSLPAWHFGMERGLYTSKALDDYIDEKDDNDTREFKEFKAARRIVNGTDKAGEIARLALLFEDALKAGKYRQ